MIIGSSILVRVVLLGPYVWYDFTLAKKLILKLLFLYGITSSNDSLDTQQWSLNRLPSKSLTFRSSTFGSPVLVSLKFLLIVAVYSLCLEYEATSFTEGLCNSLDGLSTLLVLDTLSSNLCIPFLVFIMFLILMLAGYFKADRANGTAEQSCSVLPISLAHAISADLLVAPIDCLYVANT